MSMIMFDNRTPFSAELFIVPDEECQEVALIVVTATFALDINGEMTRAEAQRPVRLADEFFAEPGMSSIRYESEIALRKPQVDVLINAVAHAPGARPADEVVVGARVGDWEKRLLVYGDRHRVSGVTASRPAPFKRMPIVYERAFGGTTDVGAMFENPVGVGYGAARSADPDVETDFPNIHDPYHDDMPAGFGAIARAWSPRREYAGVFDDEWLAHRWPAMPKGFDARHYQAAPPDQRLSRITGGEPVVLSNMTPTGHLEFELPRLDVPIHLLYDDRHHCHELPVDTVLIDPELMEMSLTGRHELKIDRRTTPLREVVLGRMTRGWLRARLGGKRFIDRAGTRGVQVGYEGLLP